MNDNISQPDLIAEKIKIIVRENGHCNLMSLVDPQKGNDNFCREIAGLIIKGGEFQAIRRENIDWDITLNPNYELSKSVKKTNEAIINNFTIQKRLTISSIIVAGASALFVAVSAYFMATDDTAKELKQMRLQFQRHMQAQDSLLQSQKTYLGKDSLKTSKYKKT
jgi:hypothetical protein